MPIKRKDESDFEQAVARDNARKRTALDSISRLPETIRDEISRALLDGKTWRHVAKICERVGLKGVTAQNVTNFRNSRTHLAWLAKQERIAAIRAEQAEGREIYEAALADGMNPADAACMVASRKTLMAIQDMDLGVIHEAATLNPNIYVAVIKAALALSKASKPGKAQPARDTSAQPAPKGGGMTEEEQRQAIVDQVDKAMGIRK